MTLTGLLKYFPYIFTIGLRARSNVRIGKYSKYTDFSKYFKVNKLPYFKAWHNTHSLHPSQSN